MNLENLYNGNENFKDYVDKCCTQYGVSKEQALNMMIVKVVAEYYVNEHK